MTQVSFKGRNSGSFTRNFEVSYSRNMGTRRNNVHFIRLEHTGIFLS